MSRAHDASPAIQTKPSPAGSSMLRATSASGLSITSGLGLKTQLILSAAADFMALVALRSGASKTAWTA